MTSARAGYPRMFAPGEAMVDLRPSARGNPSYRQGFGGDTSGFCVAATRQGVRAAALSTRGFGAVAPIPDRATVDQAFAR